jgi:hypothetical protein
MSQPQIGDFPHDPYQADSILYRLRDGVVVSEQMNLEEVLKGVLNVVMQPQITEDRYTDFPILNGASGQSYDMRKMIPRLKIIAAGAPPYYSDELVSDLAEVASAVVEIITMEEGQEVQMGDPNSGSAVWVERL